MNECRNCRKKIENGAIWCPHCGQEQVPRLDLTIPFLFVIILFIMVMRWCYKFSVSNGVESDKYFESKGYEVNNETGLWYKLDNEIITDNSYSIDGFLYNNNDDLYNVVITFKCYENNNKRVEYIESTIPFIKNNQMKRFYIRYKGKVDKCNLESIEAVNR